MAELSPLRDGDDRDALARLLDHGATLEVEYDVEAGLARHRAFVAAGPTVNPADAMGASRWWLGGTTVLAGIAAAWFATRTAPVSSASAEATPAVAPASTRSIATAPATMPPPREVPPTIADANAPATIVRSADAIVGADEAPSRPRRRAAAAAASSGEASVLPGETPAVGSNDAIAREAANLRTARRELAAGDFDAAIAACDRGDREFATGLLGVERDGLRVLARVRRDHDATAQAEARSYLAAHPAAPVSAQIRDAL